MNDTYPHSGGTLFLNLIWHQHQPLYLDPQSDQLQGPWVRTHGTKDYYDMASILEKYPNVHYNVNLTSSLLFQLEKYYVDRLRRLSMLVQIALTRRAFLHVGRGRLTRDRPGAKANEGISMTTTSIFFCTMSGMHLVLAEIQILRFPEYAALKEKYSRKENFPNRICVTSNSGSTLRTLTLTFWRESSAC